MSERVDVLLTEKGLAPSRMKAQEMIASGSVYKNGAAVRKASEKAEADDVLEIRGEVLPYVSRGGFKLQKALSVWPIDLSGRVAMDVGASTGGFTDCMLQNGALRVTAVDVGTGQLHESLRKDPRVENREQTNIRNLTKEDFPVLFDFVSVDVSFISLALVLPAVFELMAEGGECIALVKPQFEAGRENVGKKGVVKDRRAHLSVLENIAALSAGLRFSVLGLTYSPIRGPEGNIEYLIYLKKDGAQTMRVPDLKKLVEESHQRL